jgi:hypothetical protein
MPSPRRSQQLGALALLWVLALQMALPVAHASAHASFSALAAHDATHSLQPAGASQPGVSDPAACPICQSLQARVAALPPARSALAPCVAASVPFASPLPIPAHVARSAYAPRAPPSEALSLA